jgi:hypothetical protein
VKYMRGHEDAKFIDAQGVAWDGDRISPQQKAKCRKVDTGGKCVWLLDARGMPVGL